VIAAVLVPFRSTPTRSFAIGLAGFLIWALFAVVVVAVLGGTRPAVLAVITGTLAGDLFFAPPYDTLRVDVHANLFGLIAFAFVGIVVAVLIGDMARLAEEQAALRRVATLVAGAVPAHELFSAVAEEVGQVFGAHVAALSRRRSDGTVTTVATWTRDGGSMAEDAQLTPATHPIRPADRRRTARVDVSTPIMVSGRVWGDITISSRGRRLPGDTEERLGHFTDLVAMAVANADGRSELIASRARVVAAADEARRRIERNLHDGAQQRLVSLGLELRAAEAALPPELTDIKVRLSQTISGVNDMMEDLQEISRGIHPAILSKGGLGPAIKALARRSAVPVELDVRADRRLPDRVEVAAYYVVSEALTNAAKHAHASVIHVNLTADDAVVRLSVRDDGAGGASADRGSGLLGLKDRVESLGGNLNLDSPPDAGTAIQATIPVDVRSEQTNMSQPATPPSPAS
jgi:signal transduction histidine kinase